MGDYQLTRRGRTVIGVLILILVINAGYCVRTIQSHYDDLDTGNLVVTENPTTETIAEPPSEPTTEIFDIPDASEASTEALTEQPPLYTVEILEDLRTSLFEFYFIEGTAELIESYEDQLLDLYEVVKAYPEENLVIESHVNGYPNFAQTDENIELSEERSMMILNKILDQGIEKEKISVYNLGSEVPKIRESAKQSENDRVIIYFKDHYNFVNFGK